MTSTSFNPERIRYFKLDDGKMYHGGVHLGTGTAVHMLWTGACAVDGQPIHQGDVVRTKPYQLPMLIEWDEKFCRFVYTAPIRGELVQFPLNRDWAEKNLVIMGNILQSPELWPYLTKQ
jgi:hypothetical protein